MKIDTAFILAGGLGTRLRSVAPDKAKVLLDLGGRSVLERQIMSLRENGICNIVLCIGYRANEIKNYIRDGKRYKVRIYYSEESTPLGTAGALKNAEKFFDSAAFVLNGDTLTDINLSKMEQFHIAKGAIATIAIAPISISKGEYGLVSIKDDGQIISFNEKATAQKASRYYVNAGIYIISPEILTFIAQQKQISIEKEVFPLLVKKHMPIYGYIVAGKFFDIGTPKRYKKAREVFGKEML